MLKEPGLHKMGCKKEHGAVLPITLILLLVMTLLGVASINSGLFQQKMSGNMRDKERSFEASEAAIAEAEDWILLLPSATIPIASCITQPCVLSVDPNRYPEIKPVTWWNTNSAVTSASLPDLASQPQYVIEHERFVHDDNTIGQGYAPSGTQFYRVTSRATGHTTTAKTVLQGTVARRF